MRRRMVINDQQADIPFNAPQVRLWAVWFWSHADHPFPHGTLTITRS